MVGRRAFAGVIVGGLFIVACSSSSNGSDGGAGSGGAGACTETLLGGSMKCFSWTNDNFDAASYCEMAGQAMLVAGGTCPTANAVGTCTRTISSSSLTYTVSTTEYSTGNNGMTCASAKAACNQYSNPDAGVTDTFSGGC